MNESELNSTQQTASTSTQLSAPKVTEVPIKRSVHQSANSSNAQKSSKRVPANIPNTRSEEAYQILKDTVANRNLRDDSTIYGEHVASKHRKYSAHTQSVVEHLIGNILFNADMRQYEPVVPSASPAPTQHSSTMQEQHSLSSVSDNYPSNAPTPPSIVIELQTDSQGNDHFTSTPLPSPTLTQSYDQHSSDPQESLISFIKNFPTNQ